MWLLYVRHVTGRSHHPSVIHQRGKKSSWEALCFLKHEKKVLDVGEGSVAHHTSCQRSSKRVRRGVRLDLDVSCWCKQNRDTTWRLTHRRYLTVFWSGRSDRPSLPSDDKFLFFFWLSFDCFNKIQQGHRRGRQTPEVWKICLGEMTIEVHTVHSMINNEYLWKKKKILDE